MAPFRSVGQALAYYNECNPARAKSINLLEPDRSQSSKDPSEQIAIWVSTCIGLHETLRMYPPIERRLFALRNCGPRDTQLPVSEIADLLNLKERHVYKVLREIKQDLEQEFRSRSLIPDDDEDQRVAA